MLQRQDPVQGPLIVLAVDDIEVSLKADRGQRRRRPSGPRMPVGDMGFAAYFRDSEGNLMAALQNAG